MSESEIALKTMSVHSKALCIINEYVHIHRDFSTLAVFIEELSVDQIEWEEIILEIRAQLQAANYEEPAINYLVKRLAPESSGPRSYGSSDTGSCQWHLEPTEAP